MTPTAIEQLERAAAAIVGERVLENVRKQCPRSEWTLQLFVIVTERESLERKFREFVGIGNNPAEGE